jgi:hypothetical protein
MHYIKACQELNVLKALKHQESICIIEAIPRYRGLQGSVVTVLIR